MFLSLKRSAIAQYLNIAGTHQESYQISLNAQLAAIHSLTGLAHRWQLGAHSQAILAYALLYALEYMSGQENADNGNSPSSSKGPTWKMLKALSLPHQTHAWIKHYARIAKAHEVPFFLVTLVYLTLFSFAPYLRATDSCWKDFRSPIDGTNQL